VVRCAWVISGSDPFGDFYCAGGSFQGKGNAERLRALDELYPPSTIQQVAMEDGTFYRVRAGKVSGEQAAQKFADDLHTKEGFHTMVIRLDDAASGVEE
jgi:cell division protein FtsN